MATHLHEEHDIPQENIILNYPNLPQLQGQTAPEPSTIQNPTPQTNQPQENAIRPLLENPDDAEKLIETTFDKWNTAKEQGLKYQWRMVMVVGGLFSVVLLSASWLTYTGVLQGSAYTLLLGTLIGYLLTFLEDYL
ncbi:hypothetical protein [Halorussus halophilus]|uniref:hypothetical protein n=1 Tax=Halorussus halophilus TaxID=2650975 RepID=UPI001CE491E7|nr:hypothetical protein [Halorussus halophilus]